MRATSNCRPLPVSIHYTAPLPVDEIGWSWAALADLYRQMGENSRLFGTKAYDADLMRLLLLAENLPYAAAEIAYRGSSEALAKLCVAGKAVARRADIDLRVDFPSMPDLEGWRCDPLPEFLCMGQEASVQDVVNRARCWLGELYDDARTSPRDLRVEIALLWASLPRAEAELEYLGRSPTLDRMRTVSGALAKRLRSNLVDLDTTGSTQREPMVA